MKRNLRTTKYFQMNQLQYVTGDVTNPSIQDGVNVIAHGCNNVGAWGAGVTRFLSQKWPGVEDDYLYDIIRTYPQAERGGKCALSDIHKDYYVAHIVTQNGLIGPDNPQPVRYDWIEQGFNNLITKLKLQYQTEPLTIHMPQIGCGLGGGSWAEVETIVQKRLLPHASVIVYLFRG
jgi:O-acetyl-ADP-ribose deacetylase (regulator of RNase III)